MEVSARLSAERALLQARQELEVRVAARGRELESQISARYEAEGALRERNRLAAEIHDSLQQRLTGVAMQLAVTSRTLKESAGAARTSLEQARQLVRQSQDEVRRSVWNLRSIALANDDLCAALSEAARALTEGSTIRAEVTSSGERRPLCDIVQENLLRIGQEALTNAVKHSRARNIRVSLTFQENRVILELRDDGAGFDPDTAAGALGGHFGIAGMRERAHRLGAEIQIQSAPGRGSLIRVDAPLLSEITISV